MSRNREKLLTMVQGTEDSTLLICLPFGDSPRRDFKVPSSVIEELTGDSRDFLFMFGTRPEIQEEVLRENPCLIRRPDGRFESRNRNKTGAIYFVEL